MKGSNVENGNKAGLGGSVARYEFSETCWLGIGGKVRDHDHDQDQDHDYGDANVSFFLLSLNSSPSTL